jgi:hypothetical protein
MLYFKKIALREGFKHKVVGDHAFSSKPMGQGYYMRLCWSHGNEVCYTKCDAGGRKTEIIPDDFMPELKDK